MVYAVVLCCSLWILTVSVSAAIDFRQCSEKLEGPLGTISDILPLKVNASNNFTFSVLCRTTCQEDGATYLPRLRILVTEEERSYGNSWHEAAHLFSTTILSSSDEFACNASNNITDYEYRVRVVSPRFNRSIVQCGLNYISHDDPNHSEICYSATVAWITIHDWPSVSPTTVVTSVIPSTWTASSFNTMHMSTTGRSSTASSVLPTIKTTFSLSTSIQPSNTPSPQPTSECPTCSCEPTVDTGSRINIPGEASVGIIMAILAISLIVIGVLLLLTIIFYKRGRGVHQISRVAPELNDRAVRVSRDHQPAGPDALVMQNLQVDQL